MSVTDIFASEIFESEDELEQFLGNVESLMRRGQPDVAATLIEAQLMELNDGRHDIAKLAQATPVSAVRLIGWEVLDQTFRKIDRPDQPVTAMSIDISAPMALGAPDPERGNFREPDLETLYFTDSAFSFARAGRDEINHGYGRKAGVWRSAFEEAGAEVQVRGLGGIYGEVLAYQRRRELGELPSPADNDALVMGHAFVAVRLHQAIRAVIEGRGLPRAVTVLAGSNESYPFFDAPVYTRGEYYDLIEDGEDGEVEESKFASLSLAPRAADYDPGSIFQDDSQVSGTSLRRRIRDAAPVEEPANDTAPASTSLVTSLFGRLRRRPA